MADIRVFISIPIPDPGALEAPMGDLRAVRGVRVSPAEQIHITLRFVGDVDPSKVDDIEDSVRKAVEGVKPFEVTVSGTGAFPRRERPSVVWIGASPQKTMAGIAERIGRNLDACGVDYDRKPFKSHITVGRCKGPADLSAFFAEHSDREFLRFTCDRVLVMRSVLGPDGAKHTVLREIVL